MSSPKKKAVLLVGPTSSGKTPLGDLIAERGLAGQRLAHFDFGAKFREAAASSEPQPPLEPEDLEIIRESMRTGALLTEDQFHIARKILESFMTGVAEDAIIVLNGMPRHEGQAKGIAETVDVVCVVELSCDSETVLERIRRDTGGDRAGREDDLPELVAQKLKIYAEQTRPLVDFYKNNKVPVLTIPVTVVSTAPDIIGLIEPAFERLEIK